MGSSVQQWRDAPRSDHIRRLRLGRLQRDSKTIKRRSGAARRSHSEGIHAQTKDHSKKQCRGRAVCGSFILERHQYQDATAKEDGEFDDEEGECDVSHTVSPLLQRCASIFSKATDVPALVRCHCLYGTMSFASLFES